MVLDAHGHQLSGATPEAARLYDEAVRAWNLVYGDAVGLFDKARAAAPRLAMAHLGKAWIFALANDPGLRPKAASLLETVRALPLNHREDAHAAALDLHCRGARAAAVALLDRHLMQYPFDLLAQQAATLIDGFLGRFGLVRDRAGRALPLWSPHRPGYGTMLALHGFGAEEAGDYARAEDESREAADLEPLSFWPHHTVAHVMEMTGRPEDGLGWMAAREDLWSGPAHVNEVHIWWHKALCHIELGQFDAALAVYDGPLTATQRPLALSLTNASALLWRLDLLGCDVGTRWNDIAPLWEGRADGKCLAFADIHAVMAELRAGRKAEVERRLRAMRATAANGADAAALYRDVAVPIVEGLTAFHSGASGAALAALLPVRFDLWRIGGSHAQRDVVQWTMTEAAIRAGRRAVAVALANERLSARPRSIPNRRFRQRAEALPA